MSLFRVIVNLINYRKFFKSFKVLTLANKENMCALSSYVVYKAELSLYDYYKSFDKTVSYDTFVKLVRCSKGIREVLKSVIKEKLMYPDLNTFDFTLTVSDIHFFSDFEYENDSYMHFAEIYPLAYGESLIEANMLKAELGYFRYINSKNLDSQIVWQSFINRLVEDEDFREPCFTAFKNYIVNLDFTGSWYDKSVVGLLNEAKPLVPKLEKQIKEAESSGGASQ